MTFRTSCQPIGGKSEGDERLTLQELYRAHGGTVYARCRRILRDRTLAEDATHEAFLRVRPYVATTRDAGELIPLLHRIATNYCLKLIRRRNLQARMVGVDFELDSHTEPLTSFQLRQALEHLPEQTREVLVLTYAAGMTQHEVARSLGISRRTVVYRLSEVRSAEAGA